MPISIVTYDTVESIPLQCRQVIDAACGGTRYDLTTPWIEAFALHFVDRNSSIRLVTFLDQDSGQLLGWLPLTTSVAKFGVLSYRVIGTLGNYYSYDAEPLWLDGQGTKADVCDSLIESLANRDQSASMLDFGAMDQACSSFASLQSSMRRRGFVPEPYFRYVNWSLVLEGRDYSAYERGLPGAVRNTMSRKRKKLEKAGKLEIRICDDPSDVPYALGCYEEIYGKSWQRSEAHPAFIRDVVARFAARGWLRLGLLLLDSRPIAAQIWFSASRSAAIFKLVFDQEFSDFSPGTVLTVELLRRVIDVDGVESVDFLTGDDAYKRQWMNKRRELWGVRGYKKSSIVGLSFAANMLARNTLRPIMRSIRPAPVPRD